MTSEERQRGLAWDYGVLSVERRGGMLGPVLFVLPDGRQIAPFAVAPWFAEPEARGLPGLMRRLRAEGPCVPSGFDEDRPARFGWPASHAAEAIDEGHGLGSNHDWAFADERGGSVAPRIDYPADHPIARLERRILPGLGAPAIDLELTVHPCRDCLLPVGVHPTFRLPQEPGGFEIAIDAQTEIATCPGDLDASSILVPGQFAPVSAVPLRAGGTLDIRKLPLPVNAEEVVQVLDGRGAMRLRNRAEGYDVRLSWNAEDFPSCLLWLSNRGRTFEPWSGRHLALGVEPVCSAFDLGTAISSGSNPLSARGIATARSFEAGKP